MKDKTHSMNMGVSGEGLVKGFSDAGAPSTRRTQKMKQLETIGLSGVLEDEGSPEGQEFKERGGTQIGGFLPRNNTGDRF